ncbi:hypothetical protein J1N35_019249 [Gossypium stocksii]|uniref:Uncharacterized protein n=1 Tax=Gossypium stocksii TaxID=47602 RepID=A0A9D3VRT8_9ROSI|nr:hypothetical protein J1N35_019249 [Gossypium stocksii]
MIKEVTDQIEPTETCGRARKASRSMGMLLALESRVTSLKESTGNMRKTLKVVNGLTDELDSMKEQLKDFVSESLDSNVEAM